MGQTLCGLERAKLNCAAAIASDERTIEAMLAAASDAVRKWCRRDFAVNAYDELCNGSGQSRLLLRQYPVLAVESVRYAPQTVMGITNTTASNVQARVSVERDGLRLVRVSAGVKVVDTSVTWALYPTLTQLAAAVNALGNGWVATVVGDATNFGAWPSADLYVPSSFGDASASQGALACQAGAYAEVRAHSVEMRTYGWDPRGWLTRTAPYTDPEILFAEDVVWPIGQGNFRVQYSAGYPEIPEAVQEACAEWTAYMWNQAARDPALSTQVPAAGTTSGWGALHSRKMSPPGHVQALLAPYRRHTTGHESN
jgi:hypothetical protein